MFGVLLLFTIFEDLLQTRLPDFQVFLKEVWVVFCFAKADRDVLIVSIARRDLLAVVDCCPLANAVIGSTLGQRSKVWGFEVSLLAKAHLSCLFKVGLVDASLRILVSAHDKQVSVANVSIFDGLAGLKLVMLGLILQFAGTQAALLVLKQGFPRRFLKGSRG